MFPYVDDRRKARKDMYCYAELRNLAIGWSGHRVIRRSKTQTQPQNTTRRLRAHSSGSLRECARNAKGFPICIPYLRWKPTTLGGGAKLPKPRVNRVPARSAL